MTRRANTIAIARLVFIAIYVVAFIAAGFGHWSRMVFVVLYVGLWPAFLFLDWDAVWFVMVIAAYIFELRRHSAGDGFTLSFALIAFVGLLSAFTMVELEDDDPQSQFRTPSDALYWAFGGLLRINTGRSYTPLTDDGRFLGIVVAVCGVIAASMFTAKLVTWVVGERKPVEVDEPPDSAEHDLHEQVAALQVEVDRLTAADQKHDRQVEPPVG